MPLPSSRRTLVLASMLLLALLVVHSTRRPRLQADDLLKRRPLPKVFSRNPVLADRYLGTRDVDELLRFERAEPVCIQFLKRGGIPEFARLEAINKLSALRKTDPVAELLPWIEQFDGVEEHEAAHKSTLLDLAKLLPQQPAAQLRKHRDRLLPLASHGRHRTTREAALAALISADGAADQVWAMASQSSDGLLDLLRAVPQLPSEIPRAGLFANVRPLLDAPPTEPIRAAAIEAAALLDERGRETFEALSDFALQGVQTDACVRAICNIPSEQWTAERRKPLAAGLLRHLSRVPLDQRTSTEARAATKLIKTLASMMPSEDEAEIRGELDELSVKLVRIATVKEQMRYDQTVLILRAGQGVQIVFRNDDIMPHNLVIVDSPAAREEVGIAADRMQNDADAIEKGYLPESDSILHATRMIQPGQSDTLSFLAPAQPGTYAYVCTFPGHWSKMYGAIVVVDDVSQFLAANATLPSADELLGIRTVEWTFDQLASDLSRLGQGRSFENGQRMFLKASCFSCHKIGSEGGRIGPELTKINEQYKTSDEILKHIMLPSEKVEEKYATVIVETSNGQVTRGVLVIDNDDAVGLKTDPLSSCEPTMIAKADIEDLSRSRLSPMPEKLLNTIVEKDHVYDLLAYLISGGDANHALFAN